MRWRIQRRHLLQANRGKSLFLFHIKYVRKQVSTSCCLFKAQLKKTPKDTIREKVAKNGNIVIKNNLLKTHIRFFSFLKELLHCKISCLHLLTESASLQLCS